MKEIADALVTAELVVFIYVLYRSAKALGHMHKAAQSAEDSDWLLIGIRNYVAFVIAAAIYLLILTGAGAVFGPLSEHFPLLRPINGALLLGLMSGGLFLDRGIRSHVRSS